YMLSVKVGGMSHTPELSADRKTATVQTGRLDPFQGVRVWAKMPDGVLHSTGGFEGIVTVVVGIAVVIDVKKLIVFVGNEDYYEK
ncbi:MAG: hypothetical protein K2L98_00570, partial [Bacilli bacterium]|nr:hypothetical protein [Bacilli bacterium]